MDARILVVDDDRQQRRYAASVLGGLGHDVISAEGGREAIELLVDQGGRGIDLVLLDLQMPDVDGLTVLTAMRSADVSVPVVVLTADGSVNSAVDAMRAGANDFIVKPASPERLDVSIRNALAISDLASEVRRLSRTEENRLSFEDLVSVSPSIRDSIAMARRAGRSDIPILIEGESGTGKEVFARAIHGSGERAGAPFVAVNCGAMPTQLVESILFGHEKGSFTGATTKRIGKFQEADGGTLFLDEIGDLPAEAQVKLLRAIQTGEIDPIGANTPVKVDIRIISATNRDLGEMTEAGTFREDLFYRLSVFPLKLPPLRERREDLPGLARMFLKRFTASEGIPVEGFSQAAMEVIARAEWPGNVRQLENTIHRAVVLADGHQIRPADLKGIDVEASEAAPVRAGSRDGIADPTASTGTPPSDPDAADPMMRDDGHIKRLLDIEAVAISRALNLYRGRMSETARRLGIGRSTLYRKIDELQIDKGA